MFNIFFLLIIKRSNNKDPKGKPIIGKKFLLKKNLK